jgi:hypothetical protein
VISPTTAHGVFISDQIMALSLNDAVKHLSSLLTEDARDMRLSGNSQVLDLIHPSLYCLRYDDTMMSDKPLRVSGERVAAKSGTKRDVHISKKYMWLPSEFAVNEGKVTIRSYINNLNPRLYWNMYPVIAQVFEHVLPVLYMTKEIVKTYPASRILVYEDTLIQSRKDYFDDLWDQYEAQHEEYDHDFLSKEEFEDRTDLAIYQTDPRPVNIPKFGSYLHKPEYPYMAYPDIFDTSKYKQQNLQIIVKMSTTIASYRP